MKKESAKRENTIERTGKKVWEGVRAVSVKVVRFSFWEMAFLAFLLRLLVTPPFGAALAFIAASIVMVTIKYFVPAEAVSIWSYSLISIAVSLAVGLPASMIYRKVKGDTSVPAPYTTIYKN